MFWKTKNVFYGHDMSKWDYLGSTEVKWDDSTHPIFFLQHKKKNLRSYYVDTFLQKKHRLVFYQSRLEAWKQGLFPVYTMIEKPSDFLKELMSKNNWVWSNKEKWWVDAPQKVETNHANTANVISVDFSTKNIDG